MDPFDDEVFRKPAVSMRVEVVIDDMTTYTISVGEGTQSFKWLAAVVSKRRGPKNDTVVSGFRNQHGELLNPLDKIIEHSYKHQLTITADIVPCIPIDEHGDPIFSEWQQVAYVSSGHGQQWHEETTAWRQRVKDKVYHDMEHGYDADSAGTGASLVQIGDFTEKDLDSAFALDWSQVTVPGASPAEDTETVRALLRQSYSTLCKLFIYYCGFGQVGQRYGMTMLEFGHFLHLTLLLPYGSTDDLSRKSAFGGGDSKLFPLMSRCEFVEGLLQALLMSRRLREREEAKEEDDDEAEGKEESKSDRREAVGLRQLEMDLRGYLEVNVAGFWSSIASTSLLYCSPAPEANGAVKEAVYRMYQIIKQAFLAYATVPATQPALGPGLPSIEFENMLEECSLLDSSNADHMDYLAQAMRHACSPAMAPSESFNGGGAPARWCTVPSMCFCEVLDCIMKLATISLDAKMDVPSQVKLALNFVAELQSFGHK